MLVKTFVMPIGPIRTTQDGVRLVLSRFWTFPVSSMCKNAEAITKPCLAILRVEFAAERSLLDPDRVTISGVVVGIKPNPTALEVYEALNQAHENT